MKKMFNHWFQRSMMATILCCFSSVAWANPYSGPANGEETILIEKEVSEKIPYHKLAKQFAQRFLSLDTDSILTFGKGKKDRVIRTLQDIQDRTKYRFNVDQDAIEFKITVNL